MNSWSLGPLVISAQQIPVLLTLLVGLLLGWWWQRKAPLVDGQRSLIDRLFTVLWVAAVGARLVFVLRFAATYAADPWSIIDIRDGGWDWRGGAAGAALALVWITARAGAARALWVRYAVVLGVVMMFSSVVRVALTPEQVTLPTVTLHSFDGESLGSTELLDGRPMVINFWASWCPPCRREMPVLEAAQQALPQYRFVFVNQSEPLAQAQAFLAEAAPGLTDVYQDAYGRLSQELGSQALPTTVFVNAEGVVVTAHLGELSAASLQDRLRRLDPHFEGVTR